MIKTEITEMFGIKYPIICGAMMWLCKPPLCAAISNAGGLGNITAAIYETEPEFREAITETRKLTDKPFLVNISIHPSMRITTEHHFMYAKVCAEEKVAGVEISGSPLDRSLGMEVIEAFKKADVKIFQKVGSVKHAVHAAKVGYDGVYAAGWEEGGHPLSDDVTTMVLTPNTVDAVDIPVVTAGGIADGRTMAAALNLGAQGVMMATRFMVSKECDIHQNAKEELVRRPASDTTMICKSLGVQMRSLKNETARKVLAIEARGGSADEILPLLAGAQGSQAWETGNLEVGPITVGQTIGLINEVPSCRELLDQMAAECVDSLKKTNAMVLNSI